MRCDLLEVFFSMIGWCSVCVVLFFIIGGNIGCWVSCSFGG